MSMARCLAGHETASTDFCDVCGAGVSGVPGFGSERAAGKHRGPERGTASDGRTCPGCGATVSGQFCDACGLRIRVRSPFTTFSPPAEAFPSARSSSGPPESLFPPVSRPRGAVLALGPGGAARASGALRPSRPRRSRRPRGAPRRSRPRPSRRPPRGIAPPTGRPRPYAGAPDHGKPRRSRRARGAPRRGRPRRSRRPRGMPSRGRSRPGRVQVPGAARLVRRYRRL